MKKHLIHVALCLIACFGILFSFSNSNTDHLTLKSSTKELYKWISTPSQEKNGTIPFSLSVDVEITEDEQTNNLQRDQIGAPPINEVIAITNHCYFTKLRLTSPALNALEENRLPFFILYHSWKSDII